MERYIVLRSRFIGDAETHSVEYFADEHSAKQRFSSIWASDINNTDVTWSGVFMFDTENLQYISKYEINDMRQEKNTFFMLLRFFEKNGKMNHSVQYYFTSYETQSSEYKKALQRWFNVIAADLSDEQVTANGAILFDSIGYVKESRYFC